MVLSVPASLLPSPDGPLCGDLYAIGLDFARGSNNKASLYSSTTPHSSSIPGLIIIHAISHVDDAGAALSSQILYHLRQGKTAL